ncbi:MAG: hypothetical protein DHS20C16_36640 [Phycisphaerae bacterium]|nr:MAG: hypothetical protein DHS20C16_36640 [Phycisphaerae bacterium]
MQIGRFACAKRDSTGRRFIAREAESLGVEINPQFGFGSVATGRAIRYGGDYVIDGLQHGEMAGCWEELK